MIEAIEGEPPYIHETQIKIYYNIAINGKPTLKQDSLERISKEFIDFLDRCLEKDFNKRADTRELINHPFLKQAKSVDILIPVLLKLKKHKESRSIDLE